MDRSSKSDSFEQPEVISLSDDSDASPSTHRDDAEDGGSVQTGGNEAVKSEDQHGGDEAVKGAAQHGATNGAQQSDDGVTDEDQDGVSAAVIGEVQTVGDELAAESGDGQQYADCKPTTGSHLPVSEHRQTGVDDRREVGSEALKPPGKLLDVSESRVTLMPTVGYRRASGGRARRGWSRRSSADSAGARRQDDDDLVGESRARGAGLGGRARARRRPGSRGVPPLSLRQFYDSGGRDYVEYLLRHIQAGTGRRRQPEVTVSAAPETAESSSVPQCMPGLAVVDQIIAPSTTALQPAAHCRPPPVDQTVVGQTSHTGSMAAADSMTSPVDLSSRTLRRSSVSTVSWTQPADVDAADTRPSLQPLQSKTTDARLLHGDVRSWLRDDVVKFVTMVPGCSEYAETFYREKIDGISLIHLSDWHLLNVLNMRLGPALRLRIAIDAVRPDIASPPTANNWLN